MAKLSKLVQKILSECVDLKTGSRETPLLGWCDNEAASRNISRYVFAANFAHGLVLDLAAGSCYGSSILAKNGSVRKVVSVDINRNLLQYGVIVHKTESCVQADATSFPFKEEVFDTVVSLETLEHIRNQDKFIRNIRTCLKDGGVLILSTPNKFWSSPFLPNPLNLYHQREFYLGELLLLLKSHSFRIEQVWGGGKMGQSGIFRRILGSFLKYLLNLISVSPRSIDELFHRFSRQLRERKKSDKFQEPDPLRFPHIGLNSVSNLIPYEWFVLKCYKED